MTQKKKLAVCGCSFQAVSHQYKQDGTTASYKGTHWSELVSDRMNFELLNLAVPGASTSVVVLQILEAIKQKVDFIVIANSASSNRLEFYRKECQFRPYPPDIRNIHYANSRTNPFEMAGEHVTDYIVSMGIPSVEPEELRNSLVLNLAIEMGDLKDNWMFLYAIQKLVNTKIPFLVFEGRTSMPNALSINDELLEVCTEDNIIFRKDFDPFPTYLSAFEAPSYHTPPEQQIPIADYVETRIKRFL